MTKNNESNTNGTNPLRFRVSVERLSALAHIHAGLTDTVTFNNVLEVLKSYDIEQSDMNVLIDAFINMQKIQISLQPNMDYSIRASRYIANLTTIQAILVDIANNDLLAISNDDDARLDAISQEFVKLAVRGACLLSLNVYKASNQILNKYHVIPDELQKIIDILKVYRSDINKCRTCSTLAITTEMETKIISNIADIMDHIREIANS